MKLSFILTLFAIIIFVFSCTKDESKLQAQVQEQKGSQDSKKTVPVNDSTMPKSPLITFVELGSVNCVPCKRMQPIMKSIEEKYGNQIKVVFYDVLKNEFKSKSDEYKIKIIPTQVFLDENGKEIFRHEGFYPEADIDKLLQSKGLKING